jgi:hypothetical protein
MRARLKWLSMNSFSNIRRCISSNSINKHAGLPYIVTAKLGRRATTARLYELNCRAFPNHTKSILGPFKKLQATRTRAVKSNQEDKLESLSSCLLQIIPPAQLESYI